ncbi:Uncharacterised protein [Paucimonas lemoignei]|nr:Uncharacterised protein [Paucimonas lemoignei]
MWHLCLELVARPSERVRITPFMFNSSPEKPLRGLQIRGFLPLETDSAAAYEFLAPYFYPPIANHS